MDRSTVGPVQRLAGVGCLTLFVVGGAMLVLRVTGTGRPRVTISPLAPPTPITRDTHVGPCPAGRATYTSRPDGVRVTIDGGTDATLLGVKVVRQDGGAPTVTATPQPGSAGRAEFLFAAGDPPAYVIVLVRSPGHDLRCLAQPRSR